MDSANRHIQYTDERLIKQIKAGKKTAFTCLFKRYHKKIHQLLRRYIDDTAICDELSQDVFAKVFLALPNFKANSSFFTWIYQITLNTIKNYYQKRQLIWCESEKVYEITTNMCQSNQPYEPEYSLRYEKLCHKLIVSLHKLPKDLFNAFYLYDIEGFNYKQIATTLSCPLGTVRSRIHRARGLIEKLVIIKDL